MWVGEAQPMLAHQAASIKADANRSAAQSDRSLILGQYQIGGIPGLYRGCYVPKAQAFKDCA